MAHPHQHVEAVQPGHFQIQQQQTWKRVCFAIVEFAFSPEIIDCFLSVAHEMKMRADAGLQKRPLQQEHINRMIFSDQDILQLTHINIIRLLCFFGTKQSLLSHPNLCNQNYHYHVITS